MTTDKEELRKEYFKKLGIAAPIAEIENPDLFDWFFLKFEAKDKEIAEVDEQLQLYHQLITDLKAEIERMKGELPSVDEAGPIAVAICEDVKPELSVTEQSIFIAGFQECIKYLNS